jgi:CBS domain-containing protein/uncharacterized protein YrrD
MSQIVGLPVVNLDNGGKIGNVTDIAAVFREIYPMVTAFIVAGKGKKLYVPIAKIKKILEDKTVYVEGYQDLQEQQPAMSENEILLKETFWDKQIVDTSGAKVVRVNDLHFLREAPNLWVAHIDIGFKGLVRRLGLAGIFDSVMKLLFSYEPKDRLISWKFVHPIMTAQKSGALSLKIPQSRLTEMHPADLADIIADLGTDERLIVFAGFDDATAAQTFQELPLKIKVQLAGLLNHERMARILDSMAVDEAVDLLAELDRKKCNALVRLFPQEKSAQILKLLGLSKRVAGSIMNTEYISVQHNMTAGAALEKVRSESKKKEAIYYIYVLNDKEELSGIVTLRRLLLAPAEKPVAEFMRKRVVKVQIDSNIGSVADLFYKYNFVVVPVVDAHNHVQGIITMKDAFRATVNEVRKETEKGE